MRRLTQILLFLGAINTATAQHENFVKVEGTHLVLDGKPYYFLGTNFWYGMNLGSSGLGGDRKRLIRELDQLDKIGVKNLRIMAGSEGPNDSPYRIIPALQTSPGKYDNDLLEGLDYLLNEMSKRDMKAVVCLNNFWPWSGGMAQYLVWNGEDSIPYPPPHPGGSWEGYQKFTAKFYSNSSAIKDFNKHIKQIINRKNSLNGIKYTDDPTIMTWELANEPRGINATKAYQEWIKETTALIKKLDPDHLVTLGSEGYTPFPKNNGMDFKQDHNYENVDYTCIHIWIENFGWYDPENPENTYDESLRKAKEYLQKQTKEAQELNKPLVLEEFGIARDLRSYDTSSTTIQRNHYYHTMFNEIYEMALNEKAVAGCNFWAWAGDGRPSSTEGVKWVENDDFIGDPPHELQGWYSIYNSDKITIAIIQEYANKMNALCKP